MVRENEPKGKRGGACGPRCGGLPAWPACRGSSSFFFFFFFLVRRLLRYFTGVSQPAQSVSTASMVLFQFGNPPFCLQRLVEGSTWLVVLPGFPILGL